MMRIVVTDYPCDGGTCVGEWSPLDNAYIMNDGDHMTEQRIEDTVCVGSYIILHDDKAWEKFKEGVCK